MRTFRTALGAALVTLCLATPANAGYNHDRFTGAIAIALDYWGQIPCGGDITAEWKHIPEGHLAVAQWGTRPNSWRQVCEIKVDPRHPWNWPMLCTAIIHEVGHHLERPHSDNPADVMHAPYVGPAPICLQIPETDAVARGAAINRRKALAKKRAKRRADRKTPRSRTPQPSGTNRYDGR